MRTGGGGWSSGATRPRGMSKVQFLKVAAWRTDEEFGYDRWKADQYSLGKGTHDGVLVLCEAGESRAELAARLKRALRRGDATT